MPSESHGKGHHQHDPRPVASASGIICKPVPVATNKVIGVGAKVLINGQHHGYYDITVIKPSPHDGNWANHMICTVPVESVEVMQRRPEDLSRYPWFHAGINREHAKNLLDSGVDGSFLIRNSETHAGQFSISLRAHEIRETGSKDTIYHYRIQYVDGLYHISPSHRFETLSELVEHHTHSPDGLITILRCAVIRQSHQMNYGASNLDEWEIERDHIKIESRLGSGQYGDVYRGTFSQPNNHGRQPVAMKTLRDDNQVSDDFMKEMGVMKKLNHPNLLRLIGVCSRHKPYLLITEFMNKGSLLEFIKNANPMNVNHIVQLRIVLQICDAMKYLERENFIHRDLAARNCLVKDEGGGEQPLVKVADFGLSRLVEPDEIYTASQGKKFPIKWTAPEGISHKRFSVKSDVWSFGVLFWEVTSYGQQPYPGIDIANVFAMLENGKRLDRPDTCPRDSYDVMKQCWKYDADGRPTFSSLYERLLLLIDRSVRSNNPFQAPSIPDYRNHPSVMNRAPIPSGQFSPKMTRAALPPQSRPTSTRPIMTVTHPPPSSIRERPHTAMGTSNEQNFKRNEPKRKSSGFLSKLKSFGKGKSKKTRPGQSNTPVNYPLEQRQPPQITHVHHQNRNNEEPPPDIWLSRQPLNTKRELAKPVPLKPPRRSRSRSKSGSGSCSSPSSHAHSALPHPQAHSSHRFHDAQHFSLSDLGTPQVVELTPTNSQENICENSSSQSDDFSSLHSAGVHQNHRKRPMLKPPVPPPLGLQQPLHGFSSLHGGRHTPESSGTSESDTSVDITTLLFLQSRLTEGLTSPSKDKKSVVLSYGQRLCDVGQRLLENDPCVLPIKTKFKFSEKLSSVKSEVCAILSNQTRDGTRLSKYSDQLASLVKT